ncbi:hypothetical protein [Desulfovibrio sp. X2]|uniref:Rz1-like lysis system protein LysC n=1 Tax=Desulfovibrio sp. X2 TaxID=941449 RepID=UPI001F23FA6A|nr:hypothetical protein [Desulfovibrio sp. X2]
MCAACSGRQTVVTVPVVERLTPPPELLRETARPRWTGRTNADLVEYALDLAAALDACNADKAALRSWADGDGTQEKKDMGTGR